MQQYMLAAIRPGKDLEVLVDTRLTMSQQMYSCSKGASIIVGCTRQSLASCLREVVLSSERPHLDYIVQLCTP